MKKIVCVLTVMAFSVACQPPANNEAVSKLEKRIAELEKSVTELKKRPAGKPKRPQPKPQTAAYKLPTGESATMGKGTIDITLYSDFQCPFCARVDGMLKEAVNDPELKGKVKLVFKHFPLSFHKDAKPASKAAMAAGEQGAEKFWEMADKMLANQRDLKPDNFKKWAKEIGLNVGKFEKDLKANDAKYEAQIKNDMETGSKVAKVRGTPSIYVGGWQLQQRSADGIKALLKDKKLL
jgi:protein-disulfide isomerase